MGLKFYQVGDFTWHFECPGCGCLHFVSTNPAELPCWKFNGDVYCPTVTPSIRVNYGNGQICHYHITDGFFDYCADSTHEFKNQKVPVPDWQSDFSSKLLYDKKD